VGISLKVLLITGVALVLLKLPFALIGTFAVGSCMAIKWGYESIAHSDLRDASKIQRNVKKLKGSALLVPLKRLGLFNA
jgi:hypothetical protein